MGDNYLREKVTMNQSGANQATNDQIIEDEDISVIVRQVKYLNNIVNKKFWDGLPPDIRTTLEGAMRAASKYARDLSQKENDDSVEGVKKSGKSQILTLTAPEKAAWKKAMVKTHKEFEDKIGKDLLSAIYKETGFTAD